MDVEVIKKDGSKFLLSQFGTVQDFIVGSIPNVVNKVTIEGRPGSADYGAELGDRTITVPIILKGEDLHDFAHSRDELFSIIGDSEPFYIREKRRLKELQYEFVDFGKAPKWSPQTDNEYVNGKQYLVRIDGEFEFEQEGLRGFATIKFVTSGLPYAESVYTTKELNDTGLSALAEKYGLVDGIDDEKTQYTFYGEPYNENLLGDSDKIYNNADSNIANYPIKEEIKVGEKVTISIYGQLGSGRVSFILYNTSASSADYKVGRVFPEDFDDELGAYVATFSWPAGANSELRVIQQPSSATSSTTITKIKLERGEKVTPFENPGNTKTSFSVFNAGNVTVEPESMYIYITLGLVTTDGSLKLSNKTTGETFAFNKAVSNRNIYLDGMNVMEGTAINALRNTNRQRIKLVPGVNNFEITGATFSQITVSFKFYYK